MANPFPGMNPFLEDLAFWSDFQTTFIVCWRDALRAGLPRGYEARIGEKVYLVERPKVRQLVEPDVAVIRSDPAPAVSPSSGDSATAVLSPVTLPLIILDEPREAYIEITRRSDRSLVAVLELLSPWNKREPGYGDYLGKRNALIKQDVHLVELDLLIGGRRLPFGRALPRGDYHAFVSRGDHRPDCEVYSWGLRDRLPAIPIPLRAPDPDVLIPLTTAFANAFEQGFYDESPDFGRRLPVSLPVSDAAWVAETMKAVD